MRNNSIITLINLLFSFLKSIFDSLSVVCSSLFSSKKRVLKENKFLDVLNFIAHTGPKSFWKKPSGIKIGRSIGTLVTYIFNKEDKFSELKKFDK